MVMATNLLATDTSGKAEFIKPKLDIREVIRRFAPVSDHPQLLRWHTRLDEQDGAGIQVALLDSGIGWSHPMFRGAQVKARDFTGTGRVFDLTGHGTKNAGLLVGQGHGGLRGLVPACTLLVGKVLGTGDPDASAKALAQGIRWAVYEGADLIVMPLGRCRGAAVVTQAVRRALRANCQLFAAAGNRGAETLLFPARLPGVIAVSAADSNGKPLDWCSQMPQVDRYAPGEDIWSIGLEGATPVSGSSLATVLTAGVAALHLAYQRHTISSQKTIL